MKYLKNIKREAVKWNNQFHVSGKTKLFGIGANKTGTSSLRKAMKDLGYVTGNQKVAKTFIEDWGIRSFDGLINFCKSAQFFQDQPFSMPYTFIALDQAFPNSKFILTVRDNPEQWYNSITKYMGKKWGVEGRTPTKFDLQNADYIRKGWLWNTLLMLRDVDHDDIYNKEATIQRYLEHIRVVKDYFRNRPDDLLILNVADKGAHKTLCDFIGRETDQLDFPWTNKTSEITK